MGEATGNLETNKIIPRHKAAVNNNKKQKSIQATEVILDIETWITTRRKLWGIGKMRL